MHGDGAGNGILHGWKFDQKTVTGKLNDPTCLFSDQGFYHIIPSRFPGRYRTVGILFNELGIARHVGGKYGGESALVRYVGHKNPSE